MSADSIAFVMIATAAIPATGFPLVYAFRPWRKTWLGRALMTKALGMMLLIDISLAYRLFGDEYPGRDIVRLTVYALVITGLWGQFLVLLSTSRQPTET